LTAGKNSFQLAGGSGWGDTVVISITHINEFQLGCNLNYTQAKTTIKVVPAIRISN